MIQNLLCLKIFGSGDHTVKEVFHGKRKCKKCGLYLCKISSFSYAHGVTTWPVGKDTPEMVYEFCLMISWMYCCGTESRSGWRSSPAAWFKIPQWQETLLNLHEETEREKFNLWNADRTLKIQMYPYCLLLRRMSSNKWSLNVSSPYTKTVAWFGFVQQ